MSMQSHLAELEKKHKALEDQIHDCQIHPAVDDLRVVELKRKKLMVKDEIERLRHGPPPQYPLTFPDFEESGLFRAIAGDAFSMNANRRRPVRSAPAVLLLAGRLAADIFSVIFEASISARPP